MEQFGQKLDLWRLVWVVLRKLKDQIEAAALPDSVFRAEDHGLPVEE